MDCAGEGRCSLIMSALIKPELYFQSEIKQKKTMEVPDKHQSFCCPSLPKPRESEASLLAKDSEVCTAVLCRKLKSRGYGGPRQLSLVFTPDARL